MPLIQRSCRSFVGRLILSEAGVKKVPRLAKAQSARPRNKCMMVRAGRRTTDFLRGNGKLQTNQQNDSNLRKPGLFVFSKCTLCIRIMKADIESLMARRSRDCKKSEECAKRLIKIYRQLNYLHLIRFLSPR